MIVSFGVFFIFGLCYCDVNMRVFLIVLVVLILEKYSNMDLVNIGWMDLLDREEYLYEGCFRDVNENG